MTITFRSVSSGDNGGGGGPTISITKPAGVVAGDVLLAGLTAGADTIIALLNGWRELSGSPVEVDVTGGSGGTILHRMHIYTRVADGAEPASYVWDLEGAATDNIVGLILAYESVDNTTPVNVSAKAGSAGPNTTVPGFTTTVDTAMQVAIYSHANDVVYAPPSGMTERVDVQDGATDHTISAADLLLGAAGAVGSKTATPTGTAAVSGAFSIALQPAVAPTLLIGGPSGLPEDIAGGFSLG